VANENYYKGKPSLDRVIFYYIPDKEDSWARLLSGKTDVVKEIYPTDYRIMKDHRHRFYFHISPLKSYSILLYNTAHPLFSDARVRMALSYAIDRESIVRNVLNGFGVIAHGPMGVGSPYHDPDLMPVEHDVRRSVELLEEAGWSFGEEGHYIEKDGAPFEFTIIYTEGDQIAGSVVEYVQLHLNEIGVKAHSRAIPLNELMRRHLSNSEFEAVLTQAAGAYENPTALQHLWCPTAGEAAWCGSFYHPGVSNLLNKAVEERDPQEKLQLFQQAERLVAALQPGTFLFHRTSLDVLSKRITLPSPFSLDFAGICRLRYASIQTKR
jgi:peptide/nickel transport system substrate-binding protein